jgi:hypothetical protein
VTTTAKPDTTSGLPTARGFLPPGTPGHDCASYNQNCKSTRLIVAGRARGFTERITDAQMDALADDIGVRRAGSDATRSKVRAGLATPLTEGTTAVPEIAEAVAEAAHEGLPFAYRTTTGRTVLLLPIPIG